MQEFCCEVVRARAKLGIAMAANKPMMATTIMISTSVNPDFFDLSSFITAVDLSYSGGLNKAAGGYNKYYDLLFSYCRLPNRAMPCLSTHYASILSQISACMEGVIRSFRRGICRERPQKPLFPANWPAKVSHVAGHCLKFGRDSKSFNMRLRRKISPMRRACFAGPGRIYEFNCRIPEISDWT